MLNTLSSRKATPTHRMATWWLVLAGLTLGVGLSTWLLRSESSEPDGLALRHVFEELPLVQPSEAMFGPHSSAGPLIESFDKSEYVAIVHIDGEGESTDAGSQDRLSGAHSVGVRRYNATVVEDLKGGAPPKLEVVQSAQWLNGEFLPDRSNPPLEAGKTYLVFLLLEPNGKDLLVAPPSIHMVIEGRLYWAGARGDLKADGSVAEHLKYTPGDPRLGLWGTKVENAREVILKDR